MSEKPHLRRVRRAPARTVSFRSGGITAEALRRWNLEWIAEGEWRGQSPATAQKRKLVVEMLLRFAGEGDITKTTITTWCTQLRVDGKRPNTIATYWQTIRALLNWCVAHEYLSSSPLAEMPSPQAPRDQVRAFSDDQAQALIRACAKTDYPLRDAAIVSLLLETGMRASELTGLRRLDLDLDGHVVNVVGKGNRRRTVPFGRRVRLALMRWVNSVELESDGPLFPAMRAARAGLSMTRSGLQQLLERLGVIAGIEGVRVSPHTCRHYAAVAYLRGSADQFTVQALLGHTSVRTTERYVNLALADLQAKVLRHSPLDRIHKSR